MAKQEESESRRKQPPPIPEDLDALQGSDDYLRQIEALERKNNDDLTIFWALVVAGIILGLSCDSWFVIPIGGYIVAVAWNMWALIRAAHAAGNPDRIPMAIVGSFISGIYDAIKVVIIGSIFYWIRGCI